MWWPLQSLFGYLAICPMFIIFTAWHEVPTSYCALAYFAASFVLLIALPLHVCFTTPQLHSISYSAAYSCATFFSDSVVVLISQHSLVWNFYPLTWQWSFLFTASSTQNFNLLFFSSVDSLWVRCLFHLDCDGYYLSLICIVSHSSTMYWSVVMFLSWCISTMYLLWLWFAWVMKIWIQILWSVVISLVITIMDPQCIGWWPCLEPVYVGHGYSYLKDDIHIIFDDYLQLPMSGPFTNSFIPILCQVFWLTISLMTSYF